MSATTSANEVSNWRLKSCEKADASGAAARSSRSGTSYEHYGFGNANSTSLEIHAKGEIDPR
jgi:hypothetical protein